MMVSNTLKQPQTDLDHCLSGCGLRHDSSAPKHTLQQFNISTVPNSDEPRAPSKMNYYSFHIGLYTQNTHTHSTHEYSPSYSNLHIHLAIKLACMLLLIFVTSDYCRHPILCYTLSLFHYLREVQPTMTPCDLS